MTLLFAQHGNFGETYRRLRENGPERYRDQRASVFFVEEISKSEDVVVLDLLDTPYDEVLAPGLRAIGRPAKTLTKDIIKSLCNELQVRRAVVRTPNQELLNIGRRFDVPVLPSFADMFWHSGPRTWLWHKRLLRAVNCAQVPCVANHSLNASRSMVDILGLPPERVVPWDRKPIARFGPPKKAAQDPTKPQLFFAGTWREEKGLGDLMSAVAKLQEQGLEPSLSIAGHGDAEKWQARAAALGIRPAAIQFLGALPNPEVRALMCAADAVVVPSRASYPEGLPNTIHEGLASGTPLILSTHPAFSGRLKDGEAVLFFEEGKPDALAAAVRRLVETPGLYQKLSYAGQETEDNLYFGVEWTKLVHLFLQDPYDKKGWVEEISLAATGALA